MSDIDIKGLKEMGYIVQRNPEKYVIRLRMPVGQLTSIQARKLADIAESYGSGYLHMTTRQGLQIPNVNFKDLEKVTEELAEVGLEPGSCGPRVRNVVACPGIKECKYGLIDAPEIGKEIDGRYFGKVLPTKLKISVTGCPNSCAKPQENDIGIQGQLKPKIIEENCIDCKLCERTCKESAISLEKGIPKIDFAKCVLCGECIEICDYGAIVEDKRGYSIFLGGKIGRHPRLGDKLVDLADKDVIFKTIDTCLRMFEMHAKKGERFGSLVERIGIDKFKEEILGAT